MADPANLVVTVVDNDAALSWDGSPTPNVADYSIFRRSPSTGAVFNPAGTPIASGVTSLTYGDNNLPAGTYDWQVFGRVVAATVAPTITSPNNTSFTQGTAGTFTVTATGTPTPTLSMTGTLPAGVTFVAATGVLSGTPTASGTFPLVFTAANGTLPNAVQNFTLTVTPTAPAFLPTDLANCVGWWDAADATKIVSSAGKVSQWTGKNNVGSVRNLTQATSTVQPSTGTRTINSKNVLDFDGGDVLVNIAVGWPAVNTCTVFVVFLADAAANDRVVGMTEAGYPDWQSSAGGAWLSIDGSAFYVYAASAPQATVGRTLGAATQVTIRRNGAASSIWKDGTIGTDGSSWATNTLDVAPYLGIGGSMTGATPSGMFDGAIAEVVVYSAALNTTDRQTVELYLKNKWGTP